MSCVDGMLSAQGHAAAGRLHAIAMLCNKRSVHRCHLSLYNDQHQQRFWKRSANSNRTARHTVRVSAMAAMPQLLPVTSTFGVWAALNFAAALGLWSERTRHAPTHAPLRLQCTWSSAGCASVLNIKNCHNDTCTCNPWRALAGKASCGKHRVGKELSGPLVSTLVGLLFANAGFVSGSNAPRVYDTVNKFILPLAIPLLLFSADLRCALSLPQGKPLALLSSHHLGNTTIAISCLSPCRADTLAPLLIWQIA